MNKKILKTLIYTPIVLAPIPLVASCSTPTKESSEGLKVATYNLSFAVDGAPEILKGDGGSVDGSDTYLRWKNYFSISPTKQKELVEAWKQDKTKMSISDRILAERVIQIQNNAAIIQINNPDILVLNEFNNDGLGGEETLNLFIKNYLNVPQYSNGIYGGEKLKPVSYPYIESYATNTGLQQDMDLANDGIKGNQAEDAAGFGFYHGQYGFSLLSKYEIDKENTRTFQEFKWKDMPGATIPTIDRENSRLFPILNSAGKYLPEGMDIGDNWFTQEEWNNFRLSSKNHVDVPVKVNKNGKTEVINLLLSHPTPPAFELCSKTNELRNKAEIEFWDYYVKSSGNDFIVDDKGVSGGIKNNNAKFIIMGDLNADTLPNPDNNNQGINKLSTNELINKDFFGVNGANVPKSNGGKEHLENSSKDHPDPNSITAVFNKRVDYVLPSKNIKIENQGVFWPGKNEGYQKLFLDTNFDPIKNPQNPNEFLYKPIIGYKGDSKTVSSDHKMVWITIEV